MAFHPKTGQLYVGQTARGWASGEGLELVEWTGETAMDVFEVSLIKTGFRVTFTKPAGPSAADPSKYQISSWVCEYTKNYGSKRMETEQHSVSAAKLSADGKSVELTVENLAEDRLVHLRCKEVTSRDGQKVKFGEAYYTLNRLRE